MLPEIKRQLRIGKEVACRGDAACQARGQEARGVKHAIRIPANESLERDIAAPGEKAPTEAVGRIQGVSLPSGAAEDGVASGGKGRTS